MKLNFEKYSDGLIPAIVQDAKTKKVLMLGFMNQQALNTTEEIGKVTFFSRSQQKLWTKGETSGNFLELENITADCDNDTLLIKVIPRGRVCHMGTDTCFNEENTAENFLVELEKLIESRKSKPKDSSYTSSLFEQGINQIAKKFGEESVELVIEAIDKNDKLFKAEAADLLYHLLVMLVEKGIKLEEITDVLKTRQQ